MIQFKLLLFGLTVVASIGYAAYSYYTTQNEQQQQYSYGQRRRRRSSGEDDYTPTAGNTQRSLSNAERPRKRFDKTNQTCSICLVPVVKDGKYLTCGHGFHPNCIQIWFNTEKTCPNCRAPVRATDYY